MMRIIIIFCLVLLLFTSSVLAENLSISRLRINSDLQGKYEYREMVAEVVNEHNDTCLNKLELTIPLSSRMYYAKDLNGDVGTEQLEKRLKLVFPKCIEGGETRLVFLKLRSPQVNELSRGSYRFVFDYTPDASISEFSHSVLMPSSFVIDDLVEVKPSAQITERDGEVKLSWDYQGLNSSVVHIITYRLEGQRTNRLLYAGIILVMLVCAGLIVFWFIRKRSRTKKLIRRISALNEKEKAIIELIIENDGIHQSKIRTKLDLTKSNLSKTLAKLEFRGLIVRKSEGKINRWFVGEKLIKPKN